jgi:transcriptional regulator with XRE-family HTH domain
MTQSDVARHFNVDKGTACRWDTGQTKLSLEVLNEAAALFGCDRIWLAFGEGQPPQVVSSRPAGSKARAPRKAS